VCKHSLTAENTFLHNQQFCSFTAFKNDHSNLHKM
jgi:hypothetical protein